MKPHIALLLPCALFVACGGGANSPEPSPVTLSCADGVLINAGSYRAQNNTWGKGALAGWSQCIGIDAGAGDPVVGRWTWNWPNSGGNVKAYPEVIFGYKPAASPTTSQLPRRITDITELTVRYDFASSHSGSGNTAFDIWLTDTSIPSTFAVPPITHEVMVWLESYGGMTPGGAFTETATIDGTAYEVFVANNFGSGGWRYIAFRRVLPQLGSATLNVKALLDYARTKSLVTGTEYVASVEFGNEIIGPWRQPAEFVCRIREVNVTAGAVMMLRFFLVALLVLPHLAGAQTISFTFDDGFDPRKDPRAIEWNRALLAALTKHQVEAMLFPAGRNVNAESGLELAKEWARAGHAIGNHTFSHRSLGSTRVTLADFIEDVQVADRMLRNLAHWTPMLRFPYLKEGETRAKRDGMRAWMRAHAYRAAPVSIDTSDWYYNERYLQLLQQGRDQLLPILREAYLAHLKSKALYYDELARAALARSPAHVMLLHTNAINAAWAGDMIEMFKAMGWQIVQPVTAFADPLYARQSQTLPAGESIVWALAKETGLEGLRYPAEDGEYEKPLLDKLGL